MEKTSTLVSAINELEATYWLEIFEKLPDNYFDNKPIASIKQAILLAKQYARSFVMVGSDPLPQN